MKLTTLNAHLVPMLGLDISDFTELHRALKEQSSHFADEGRVAAEWSQFDGALLRSRRGPGGTVEATPFTSGFLLLAVMIDGPRKDAALRTWKAWHLSAGEQEGARWEGDPLASGQVCPLTGDRLFGGALKAILTETDLATRVDEVRVDGHEYAEIHFDAGEVSHFGEQRSANLRRVAILSGLVLQGVSQLIKRAA